ncbi:MAG: ECF-type sigma factor [Rhodothermales bacterium]
MATPPLTRYLQQASQGDRAAFDHLFSMVYEELQHLAQKVRSDRPAVQMSTVSLVHEAYAKLLPSQNLPWNDRLHFYRVAARAMRQVLVNAAQHQRRQKRGSGAIHVTLTHLNDHDTESTSDQVLALHEGLSELEKMNERQARIVEYRVFCGFTIEETARMLSVSEATIKRDWLAARAWLGMYLRS